MARQINDAGLKLIESFEGLRLTVYKDPVGIPTVGYGHVVRPQDTLSVGDTITQDQADAFLRADLQVAEHGVESVITGNLTDNEFAACVSLAFNIGVANFAHSTLAKDINGGNLEAAAHQFLAWNKAGGRVLPGLVRRRQAEMDLFQSP
jgi:lysozyme